MRSGHLPVARPEHGVVGAGRRQQPLHLGPGDHVLEAPEPVLRLEVGGEEPVAGGRRPRRRPRPRPPRAAWPGRWRPPGRRRGTRGTPSTLRSRGTGRRPGGPRSSVSAGSSSAKSVGLAVSRAAPASGLPAAVAAAGGRAPRRRSTLGSGSSKPVRGRSRSQRSIMRAARRPWPTASAMVVGPVTASPAAKTPGSAVVQRGRVRLERPRPGGGQRTGKAAVSAPIPTATMAMSQPSVVAGRLVVAGAEPVGSASKHRYAALEHRPPRRDLAAEPGDAPSVVQLRRPRPGPPRPPSRRRASRGAAPGRPGARRSRPRRRALRAASMATLPPPIDRHGLAAEVRRLVEPDVARGSRARGRTPPRVSSPGTRRRAGRGVPVATRTASKPWARSASRSSTRVPVTISTPRLGHVAGRRARPPRRAGGRRGWRAAAHLPPGARPRRP